MFVPRNRFPSSCQTEEQNHLDKSVDLPIAITVNLLCTKQIAKDRTKINAKYLRPTLTGDKPSSMPSRAPTIITDRICRLKLENMLT